MIVFIGVIAIVAVAILSFLGGSFYSVDQGERAVITRWGKIVSVSEPGFHTKTPFIEDANTIEIRQLSTELKDVLSYSKDQQAAALSLTILWHVPADRVTDVYSIYGSLEALASRELASKVPSASKIIFGHYNAATAIQERGKMVSEIDRAVRETMGEAPIVIDSVQLVNIDFSDAYEHAIEERMGAEVEVQKRAQLAQQAIEDAKATVTAAKAEADSNLARRTAEAAGNFAIAQAQAKGIDALADAEANRLRKRGEALRDNPQLIALTTAEKWNGQLPYSMVPGNAIPFLDLAR